MFFDNTPQPGRRGGSKRKEERVIMASTQRRWVLVAILSLLFPPPSSFAFTPLSPSLSYTQDSLFRVFNSPNSLRQSFFFFNFVIRKVDRGFLLCPLLPIKKIKIACFVLRKISNHLAEDERNVNGMRGKACLNVWILIWWRSFIFKDVKSAENWD